MTDFYFLNNNLFTTYTLEIDFPRIYDFKNQEQQAKQAFEAIQKLYDKDIFKQQNEHQFEDDFITKVLQILGWEFVRQDEKMIQGKIDKPDFLLFANIDSKKSYENIPKEQRKSENSHIAVILESKAYDVEVDNKKIKDNPHFQLLRYLNNLKVNFGFLTNGRVWRFYDNSTLSSQKVFYEVCLEKLLESNDFKSFHYFYHLFHANNFTKKENLQMPIHDILAENTKSKIALEDDLQSIIYGINGRDSLFEKIGAWIYAQNQNARLNDIYENSLYFIFRILFIAYFEDKFDSILQTHLYFKNKISLYTLLINLKQDPIVQMTGGKSYCGIVELERIFDIYDRGNPHYDMPVFNGGLFDKSNTPLLKTPKIFNDKSLIEILDSLFNYQDNISLFRRDYYTLSISHLGTIYEGLLSYFFEIANEDLCYLVYQPKKSKNKLSSIEGYFDSYDTAQIEQSSKIHAIQSYKKGQIYLKNTSNSRKNTASFYTPEAMTTFLVQSALDNALNDSNILHFKILDNACGSGHFLVEALNQITEMILNRFDDFPTLKTIYNEEKQAIQKNIIELIQGYVVDENDILKRLLLKRMIFGVDVNPFSIELTKLALWIDSFIFGTPLSFIEHHIKCGNALIGTKIEDFEKYYTDSQKTKKGEKQQGSLFVSSFLEQFQELRKGLLKLDSIKDNTELEIKESKRIYENEIAPILTKLNFFLNLYNVRSFMDKQELKQIGRLENDNIEKLVDFSDNQYQELREIIQSYAKKFRFFNYEIEFPEIVSDGKFVGFQAIVGNPPWDKTKFSDSDFFPQYQSNYRILSNTKKQEIQDNLLAKLYIAKAYEAQKSFIEIQNAYYKTHYPLNSGSGDGNLFRFFVECNLKLLAPSASLNYVLPSALMLEEGSVTLRKEILTNKQLEFFYSFENREGIFHDIDSRYKFALIQIYNQKPKPRHRIKTMFYQTKIESIYNKKNIITCTFNQIKTLSPNQLALQEVHSQKDIEILRTCYAAFAPLSPEWLDMRRELDMTNDKDLFLDFRNELHMTQDKDLFIESFQDGLLPLYEGKMIHQFNAEFSTPQYFLDSQAFDERLRNKEIHRLKQDLGIDNKEYERLLGTLYPKKIKQETEDSMIFPDRIFYRIAFRAIARDTDEYTTIFSLLPKNCGFGHSMFANIPKKYKLDSDTITYIPISHLRILFSLGIFNSLVVNFIARGMIQINVSKTYLERIPFPQPSDDEILANPIYKDIAQSALKLQLYNDKAGYFSELAKEFGIDKSQIPTTQKLYDELRAKLDITITKLYKLDYEDFCHLLESFKVLQSNQPQYIALLKSLWINNEISLSK